MPLKSASATRKTLASFGAVATVFLLGLLAACSGGSGPEVSTNTSSPSVPSNLETGTLQQETQPSVTSPPPSTLPPANTPTTGDTLPPEEVPSPDEVIGLAGITESLNEILAELNEGESESEPLNEADIRVVVSEGELVEGESRYEVSQGESIVIEVYSNQFEHEVHVHGYDLTAFAGPITPARFEFVADLAGTWEVEFEDTHELIFELVVS